MNVSYGDDNTQSVVYVPDIFIPGNVSTRMSNAYTVILCCERIEDAISVSDPSALRQRLQELADILADDQLEDSVYDELEREAIKLVDRATDQDKLNAAIDLDADESEIPKELRRDITTLTNRVARCYLRSSMYDPSAVSEDRDSEREVHTVDKSQTGQQPDIDSKAESWQRRASAVISEQSPHTETADVGDAADEAHQDETTKETTYDIDNSANIIINSDNSKNDHHES